MYTETYLTKPSLLQKRINNLNIRRGKSKLKISRTNRLSEDQRRIIHSKTNGRCHFCGIKVHFDEFQADHVVSHTRSGNNNVDNYLPSCFICNNYRWHYLPRELQLIIKLGVWAKTEIKRQSPIGKEIAKKFTMKESSRIQRKKTSKKVGF